MDDLSDDLLLELLDETSPAFIPEQTSNYVRWLDKEMRCASRGCGSSTYCKVQGVPYCMMHTIRKLTELLDNMIPPPSSPPPPPPKYLNL